MKYGAALLTFALLWACTPPIEPARETLFVERAAQAGIDFRNDLEENEAQNIVDYLYFYNGAGVAVADFNRDGWEDIYFVRNQGANALYWNRGNGTFEEGAEAAGVRGKADFQNGVSIVDINADGYPDVYVSAVNHLNWQGHNEFYLNNGDGTFRELSDSLGLALHGYGQQALFFDADNDGDQDLYVLRHSARPPGTFNNVSLRARTDVAAGDLFFRNVGSENWPVFEDQTLRSGILSSPIGYGLSVVAEDFNSDGYLDLFVGNDFYENDYLYLNVGGERFELVSTESFQSQSKFTMGADAADFNHDGTPDLFTLDMKPWDEVERKNALGPDPFHIHKYKRNQGYVEQFPRNHLHLHAGNLNRGGMALPVFEEAAQALGAESTDWSWGVLLADFDGNGSTDAFITNGIKRRPNDLDYIQFLSNEGGGASDAEIYTQMPPGAVANRAFTTVEDHGRIWLKECAKEWGLDAIGASNGSALADFNNDGRLDLVVNNLDGPALLYMNALGEPTTTVDFGGYHVRYQKRLGARARWNLGTRGWLSHSSGRRAVDDFGGALVVQWPSGTWESFTLLPGEVNFLQPGGGQPLRPENLASAPSYTPQTALPVDTLPFAHEEDAYTSFVQTPLLIEGVDELGPAGHWFGGQLFVGGSFLKTPMWARPGSWDTTTLVAEAGFEDVDAAEIELAGGRKGLIVVTGGGQFPTESDATRDRIYFAPGQPATALNGPGTQASSLAVLDVNGDGLQDAFIGERSVWDDFGASPTHALYLGTPEGSLEIAEMPLWAQDLGMITDLSAADLDGNGEDDLLIATDWGPVYAVYFDGGKGRREALTGNGWWRHVRAADLDGDGDLDVLAGAVGENHGIHVSEGEPIELYIKDFDNNGDRDFIYSYWNQGKKFPLFGRDELIKESVQFRKSYLKNRDFSGKTFDELFSGQLDDAQHLQVTSTSSGVLVNEGGAFSFIPLPTKGQLAPITASLVEENGLLIAGGSDAMHTSVGTQESFCGARLRIVSGQVVLTPSPWLLRGSVAEFLPTAGGCVVLMNDGPALWLGREEN